MSLDYVIPSVTCGPQPSPAGPTELARSRTRVLAMNGLPSKWQRFIQLMHKRARMNPGSDPVTSAVCAAPPPVCHFVSVTGRIAYLTVVK